MHHCITSTFGTIERQRLAEGFRFTETFHHTGKSIAPHSHDLATVNFVLEGRYCESCTATTGEFERFQVLYKPPGEVHSNRFGSSHARCLLIELAPHRFAELQPQLAWLSRSIQCDTPEVRSAAFRLMSALDEEPSDGRLPLESATIEFLLQIGGAASSPSRRVPQWLHNTKEFLDANIEREMSLSEISTEFGVHVAHLAREFKRHFALTIGEYLRARRLDNAVRMLTASRLPIVQIADRCGFADQSHFNRWFRKSYRNTPARFRRRFAREDCIVKRNTPRVG